MDNMEHTTIGGYREGSGRKQKFGEQTVTVSFRIPKSKVAQLKKQIKKLIDNHKTKKK
ncbi:MAG TPA: hypothetical protein PLF59_19375 [Cyclobacteriaceae bacterium]|nr:hypothetical protein [Cyclobacteriaceae bacterium]